MAFTALPPIPKNPIPAQPFAFGLQARLAPTMLISLWPWTMDPTGDPAQALSTLRPGLIRPYARHPLLLLFDHLYLLRYNSSPLFSMYIICGTANSLLHSVSLILFTVLVHLIIAAHIT